MRKFINYVMMLAATFFAGTATVSVMDYAKSVTNRPDGAIGGEILILPLMIVLVYIGWLIAKIYFSTVIADKIYNSAYKKGYNKGKSE